MIFYYYTLKLKINNDIRLLTEMQQREQEKVQ